MDPGVERQERAMGAAVAIARRSGLRVDSPKILYDSNRTVIHLAPAPVVAKVETRPAKRTDTGLEIRVARALADSGAHVVPPSSLLPPGPHDENGVHLTFWEYCPHSGEEPSEDTMGSALRALHDALRHVREPLPPWDDFKAMEEVLNDTTALHALSSADRAFLQRTYDDLREETEGMEYTPRPLHGEPHARNLLLTPHGPRWTDFEAACAGPLEWDLSVLPDDVVRHHFEDVDYDRLSTLRQLRSLIVAVWCWVEPDRSPVLREAGTHHLERLKSLRVR